MTHTDEFSAALSLAKAGDRGAFRHAYEHSNDKVFRFLLGQLGDREHALDTLQDVYIDLWKALPKMRIESVEGCWGFLFIIARRKVYAARDKRSRADVLVDTETFDFLHEGEAPNPESRDDARVLHQALARVSRISQEILNLRYWSELSFKEIALILGTTENAAKVRHHRALKELHEHLSPTYAAQ
jgi:RNA polymerase sigma-70 factor, ECF subfamily